SRTSRFRTSATGLARRTRAHRQGVPPPTVAAYTPPQHPVASTSESSLSANYAPHPQDDSAHGALGLFLRTAPQQGPRRRMRIQLRSPVHLVRWSYLTTPQRVPSPALKESIKVEHRALQVVSGRCACPSAAHATPRMLTRSPPTPRLLGNVDIFGEYGECGYAASHDTDNGAVPNPGRVAVEDTERDRDPVGPFLQARARARGGVQSRSALEKRARG
ncbi:hypothetical protein B0H13DRAFT_2044900, partial [Mycena leptocephala]